MLRLKAIIAEAPQFPLTSSRHLPSLDGLRGLAVLMVLLFHSEDVLGWWTSHGYLGVTLFFVLSGFLITGILVDTRSSPNFFKSFYARRALRIFPVYYGALAILFLLVPRLAPSAPLPPRHDWPFYLVYLNNWTSLLWEQNNLGFTGHFWSLAVEEQFYAVWPLIVFLVPAHRLKWVTLLGTILGVATYFFLRRAGVSYQRNTIVALPSLMLGAYCALLLRDRAKGALIARHGVLLFASSLAAMATFVIAGMLRLRGAVADELSWLSIVLSFGLLMLSAIDGPPLLRKTLSWKPIRLIGRYSYGMYVYHIAIFTAFAWLVPKPPLLRGVLQILAAIAVAAFSYEIVERRINALKKRFSAR
jgi:peptidoglycan/LPS O-acetylase OafA/YrhL